MSTAWRDNDPARIMAIRVSHQLTKLSAPEQTKKFYLDKQPNLGYADVKLNIACMHRLACMHTLSLCVY